MNIKEIKQLIREEVKSSLKRMINEQDGEDFKVFLIKGRRLKFYVAVKGDEVFIYNQEKHSLGTKIGGKDLNTFKNSIQNGVPVGEYGMGYKFLNNKFKMANVSINDLLSTSVPEATNKYGFIVDNGTPKLVVLDSKDKLYTAIGSPVKVTTTNKEVPGEPGNDNTTPPPSSTRKIGVNVKGGFLVNKTVLTPQAQKELDDFIMNLKQNKDKIKDRVFWVITSASADRIQSKDSDNKLSIDRAKAITNYLKQQLSDIPEFQFKPFSMGQTWIWAPETKYALDNVQKGSEQEKIGYQASLPNRRLFVVPERLKSQVLNGQIK